MRTLAAIGLFLAAFVTGIWADGDEGFSISCLMCNNTWNPSCPSNRKVPIQKLCNLKLHVTSLRNESDGGSNETVAASISLLVSAGLETLHAKHVIGVDYFPVTSLNVRLNAHGTTEIDLSQQILNMPNKCGQTYSIVRLDVNDDRQNQAMPMQLECPEKTADLALIGETKENYDMYTKRAMVQVNGQSIKYYIKDLKLSVKNVGNETYSSRNGMDSILVTAYAKNQKWFMYQWGVGNQSEQTVAHVDNQLLEFELGDQMLSHGHEMSGVEGGRGTPSLTPGYQLDLNTDKLLLKSKSVCGNSVIIFRLSTSCEPKDVNLVNNYLIYPTFIDCWGHNPVQTVENCEVIPNYFDGGMTAFIVYVESGQVTVYEYQSSDKSIRQLKESEDGTIIKDVARMKLQVDVHSHRLLQLGQCVDSLWGSSDSFVTNVDVVVTNILNRWEDVNPETKLQTDQYNKIKLILDTICDIIALMLQPSNPLHEFLHVPFSAYFNPYYSYVNSYYDNSVNRAKREVTSPSANESTSSQSLNVPTTSSPPITSSQESTGSEGSTTTSFTSTRSESSSTVRDSTSTGSQSSAMPHSTSIENETKTATYSTPTESWGTRQTGSTPILMATQTLSGTPTSNTQIYEEVDEETAFGPQHSLHRTISDWVNDIVQNGGQNHQVLSPDRWHALATIMKGFFYGKKEDLNNFLYIPAMTRENIVKIFSMINRLQLPRFFDNIPTELYQQMSDWFNTKSMRTRNFGSASCDYEEGLSFALNITQRLMQYENMTQHRDQLKLITYVINVLSADDHCEYYARLYHKLVTADNQRLTWMMRDGIPIHEPSREDVCKRSTAVKLWQLKKKPVFQFAAKTMSPDHYNSVFWEKVDGTIFRGDRSDLTGQVFWTKVATCSCPNSSCDSSNTSSSPRPGATSDPMKAAPVLKNEASVQLKNNEHDLEEAEDLIFSN